MCTVIIKTQDREIVVNNVVKGTNLLDLLTQNDIYVPANCGRRGTCGRCKVDITINNKVQTVSSCKYAIFDDIQVSLSQITANDFKVNKAEQAGLAIDIGTTTIALYYIDMQTGESQTFSTLNKQAAFGADVLSRIKACEEGNLLELQAIIVKQLNQMLSNIPNAKALPVVISANNTMLHILLGQDPSSLGKHPFAPLFKDTKRLNGKDIGLNCSVLTLLPSVSAFFGADAVCGMASAQVADQDGVSLFIDIGTNAEMALSHNGTITACAAAAGPAFEGANIEMGMGAVEGAIDHVFFIEDKLSFSVIGDSKPIGICGSGLIDAIALLIQYGTINFYGTFTQKQTKLSKFIQKDKFFLSNTVHISQADIREYQLAKSAVYTGIMTLLEIHNLEPNDITRIYIAGGFGYYVNITSATASGMLPKDCAHKVISIGNASGKGAMQALQDNDFITECERLATSIKIIELAETTDFMDKFIENINFEN